MAVLTFPSKVPNSAAFGLVSNTQAHISPLSKTVQTVELPGAHWRLDLSYHDLDQDDAAVMRAFLASLMGPAGRFYYGDADYQVRGPRGIATGTPLVDGAGQTGTSINIKGFTPSQTGIMKAGDYFHFDNTASGREMKIMTADADSAADGTTTLNFVSPVRTSPADNAAITITGAMAQMMLVDDRQAGWQQRPGPFADFSISAIEAFTGAG